MLVTKLENENLYVSYEHLYNYGVNKSIYLAYLLQLQQEAIKSNPQSNGKFYLTNRELVEKLKLCEQTVRSYKKWAVEKGLINVELKGSPPKQWYTINIKDKATD
jgi:hypothetical protein